MIIFVVIHTMHVLCAGVYIKRSIHVYNISLTLIVFFVSTFVQLKLFSVQTKGTLLLFIYYCWIVEIVVLDMNAVQRL